MSGAVIDVASGEFWGTALIAVLVIGPLASDGPRRVALAALNLFFVGLIIQGALAGVLVALALVHAACHAIARRRIGWAIAAGTGVAALALFAAHKLPGVFSRLGFASIHPVLSALGFSYVFLRLVDLLREVAARRCPAPRFSQLVSYLLPFHMLAAGPIQPYAEFLADDRVAPPLDLRGAIAGAERVVTGLCKKFIAAFAIERLLSTGWRAEGWYFFVEVQAHFLWLYLDFSAYSDIAAGIGRLAGIATPENFRSPFASRNLTEFWERWHITLGSFVRRNLYVPVCLVVSRACGGRRPLAAAAVAVVASFLACGAWHELSPAYAIWGAMHGLGLVACMVYRAGLLRVLGASGVKSYARSRGIRLASTLLTLEYVAFSVMVVGDRWQTSW